MYIAMQNQAFNGLKAKTILNFDMALPRNDHLIVPFQNNTPAIY